MRVLLKWILLIALTGAATVCAVLLGSQSAMAVDPNVSIDTTTVGRDASTGKFTYSITASADSYWSTICTSAYCHLQIEARYANGTVATLATQPANTGGGASTTKTFTGSTLVREVTDVRALILGSGGQWYSSWVAVSDPYPSPSASLIVNSVGRRAVDGHFAWDVTATTSYFNLPDGPCPVSSCYLYLQAKFDDGTTMNIDDVSGLSSVTTFPKSYNIQDHRLSREVTHLRPIVHGSNGDVVGSWVAVSDPYPTPSVSLVVNSVGRQAIDGHFTWDVTATASYTNLPDGPCPTTNCHLYVEAKLDDGTTVYIDHAAGLGSVSNFPKSYSLVNHGLYRRVTQLRPIVYGNGDQIVGAWVAVSDPYPQPAVSISINSLHRGSDGKLSWDITGTASYYWLPDGVCNLNSWCYMEVVQEISTGEQVFLLQMQQSINGRQYPYSRVFVDSKSVPDMFQVGRLKIRVRGPNGYIDSGWLNPQAQIVGESIGGGNPAEKTCQCSHADPVNTATGEFYLPNTDLVLPGTGPEVGVTRTYSSTLRAQNGPFGYGWSAGFNARLVVDIAGDSSNPLPAAVHIEQENGSRAPFYRSGVNDYPAAPWILATLERDPVTGGWTYSGSGGRQVDLTWSSGRVVKVEDSAGRSVTYSYNGSGNLTSVTDVAGNVWAYGYDSSHRMTTLTSPEGGITTNTYDSSSRVTAQSDPLSRTTTFSYSSAATTTTFPDGSKTVEEYDRGNVVRVTRAQGTALESVTEFEYNSTGDLVSVTDPMENETVSTFDSRGNALTTTDALNRTTTRTFDALNNVTSVEDPLGRTTEMTYNSTGDLTSLTSPGGHEQTWTLNGNGTIASHTDARNKTTTYTYDSAGRPLCATDPESRETCVEYDARGFVVTAVDGEGAESEFTYDDLGRVLVAADPNGAETTTTYDDDGNPITVEDPLGNVTTMTYDDADQRLTVTNPLIGVTTYTYSPRGEVATVTDPNSAVTATTYDALNRISSVTDGENRTTNYAYDLLGRLLTTTRPSGAQTHNTYDDAGQLTLSTDALGNDTSYVYDDAGQLTSVTDPLNRVTVSTYTDDGLVDTVTYPDASTEVHEYDANGQETSFTNADGDESTYVYDDAGQLVSKTEPGDLETTYSYDDAGRLEGVVTPDGHASARNYDDAGHLLGIDYVGTADAVTFAYDDAGHRLTMTDATGTTTYTYTDAGQVASVQNGNGQTLAYEYDDAGQLLTLTYPGNHDVDYAYDDAGQLISVTGWVSGVTEFAYTPDGYLASREDPNGVTETRTFDAAGQLTGIVDETTSTTLADYGYAFDDAGQLVTTTMTDALHSVTTQNWGYDPIGQLTTTSSPSGTYAGTSAGLLTATPRNDVLSYNTAGQLESLENVNLGLQIDYSYDDNGARIGQIEDYAAGPDLVIDYTYNEAGALIGYDDGTTTITYGVDGDGLRQSRTDGTTTSEFLWDVAAGLPLLLDDDDYTYVYGPGITPIARIVGSGDVEYLYTDNLGSVRTITDDTGTVVSTTDYDPYGRVLATSGSGAGKIANTGAWTDPETSLVYLRARDYDPRSGQFTRVDPAVDDTRQAYTYADNRPLLLVDPTGLCIGLDNTPQDRPCNYRDFYVNGLGPSIGQQAEIAYAGFSAGSTFGIGLLTNNDVACYGSNPMFWAEYGLGVTVSAAAILATGGKSVEFQIGARAPELQAKYRVVGSEELASIEAGGSYSLIPGLEGKYFFPTLEQATSLAGHFAKLGQQTITSGTVARSLIPLNDIIAPAGEGVAFFLRGEQLISEITNVAIHGG